MKPFYTHTYTFICTYYILHSPTNIHTTPHPIYKYVRRHYFVVLWSFRLESVRIHIYSCTNTDARLYVYTYILYGQLDSHRVHTRVYCVWTGPVQWSAIVVIADGKKKKRFVRIENLCGMSAFRYGSARGRKRKFCE